MATLIDVPGIFDVPEALYHADPVVEPSLSSSIATTLITKSPMHARAEHPRLNPGATRTATDKMNIGTVAHALLLEGKEKVAVVEADDWRTKAAREARDAVIAEGRVPLLAKDFADVQAMVASTLGQLALHPTPRPISNGKPERTIVWREGPVWCRARLDWLHDDFSHVDDYKTTSGSANPEDWIRSLYASGRDLQVAFYLRGVRAVTGQSARWRYVVQETFEPYALSVIGLGPDALVLAEKKVQRAIDLWAACVESGEWPGYPTETCYAELPGWEEARWLARELRESA